MSAPRPASRPRRVAALVGAFAAVTCVVELRQATAAAPHSALAGALLPPAGAVRRVAPPTTARTTAPTTAAPATFGPAAAAPRPSSARASASPAVGPVTLTGDPVDVGYGTVQVQITMQGGRITGVTALSLPSGGRSSDISSYAAPQLRAETLQAQTAGIDAVSGASYTSAGYARSLQSALDRAAG